MHRAAIAILQKIWTNEKAPLPRRHGTAIVYLQKFNFFNRLHLWLVADGGGADRDGEGKGRGRENALGGREGEGAGVTRGTGGRGETEVGEGARR